MRNLTLRQMAWLLPLMFVLHIVEEHTMEFTQWYSYFIGADFSVSEYFAINFIAFSILILFSALYSMGRGSDFVMWVINSVLFLNGVLHVLLSIIFFTYSPGVFTGLLILIPVGWVIYGKLRDELLDRQRFTGTVLGGAILLMIAMIAYTI